mmetsp:Transcript_4601/g.7709  ORF Transcript_4601/g.7709 Transcript_4601/m.7709 type:complete len:107 (+) Transcript_4601:262-582(+)
MLRLLVHRMLVLSVLFYYYKWRPPIILIVCYESMMLKSNSNIRRDCKEGSNASAFLFEELKASSHIPSTSCCGYPTAAPTLEVPRTFAFATVITTKCFHRKTIRLA